MARSRIRVLYLCTGNSCRSQMAEGFTRRLHGERFEVASAGLVARGLDALAVEAMREAGVDISGQRSTTLAELGDRPFDHVITVCGHADAHCPTFPAKTHRLHVPFDDPPRLAAAAGDPERAMQVYRRVRDEIRAFVETLPDTLAARSTGM